MPQRTTATRQSTKHLRKRLPISLGIVLILAGASVAAYNLHWFGIHKKTSQTVHIRTNDGKVLTVTPGTSQDNATVDQQKANGTLGVPPTTPSSITVSISRAAQSTTENDVQIRLLVIGTTSGTCKISLAQAGQATITQTAAVANKGNYYGCDGFDVPLATFSVGGQWQVTASVDNNGQSASANQTVTVTK